MLTLEQIIAVALLGIAAICLLAFAFVATVKSYRIVEQNEELREYVEIHEERRKRGLNYLLNTLCRYDEEYLDYAVQKQLGHITPPPPRPPLRVNYGEPPRPRQIEQQPARTIPTARTTTHRQPESRVVFVHEPRREPPPRKPLLSFWGNDDDDVIDIEPAAPTPHRAMPQVPLLGKPKNKGGRPRKHTDGAARKRAYDQRKRGEE